MSTARPRPPHRRAATSGAASGVWTGEPRSDPVARTGDWVGAVLLAIIMPGIGVIAGVYYVARGGQRAQCGSLCLGLSALFATLWVVLLHRPG